MLNQLNVVLSWMLSIQPPNWKPQKASFACQVKSNSSRKDYFQLRHNSSPATHLIQRPRRVRFVRIDEHDGIKPEFQLLHNNLRYG